MKTPLKALLAIVSLGFVALLAFAQTTNPPSIRPVDGSSPAQFTPSFHLSPIVVTATSATLTANQSGATVINYGASGAVTNTLPPSAGNPVGITYRVIVMHNTPFVFKVSGTGDGIGTDGGLNPAAGNTNDATWGIGQSCLITLVQSNKWVMEPIHGTNWINNL